eukprot:9289714-Pyramimonas_sp.AAC.1
MGHQFFDCAEAFASGEDQGSGCGFSDDVWQHRQALREKGQNLGSSEWDVVSSLYGVPSLHFQLSPPQARPPVLSWGLA